MSPPSLWGPSTWTLFHTLSIQITEDGFSKIGQQLFMQIKSICNNLPCPICAGHAKEYFSRINVNNIKRKEDLQKLLWSFHNTVNRRKKKPLFNSFGLEKYKQCKMVDVYNNFAKNYNTKGIMTLMADSLQRTVTINNFKKWITNNYQYFHGGIPPLTPLEGKLVVPSPVSTLVPNPIP
jgi:hypothetical protein